jgi:hypothetical protein
MGFPARVVTRTRRLRLPGQSELTGSSTHKHMSRLDPLGVALPACSLAVFLLHGFGAKMSRDVSVYAYAGQQVAEGVPPYENILNRAGPLAHLTPGTGVLVGRELGVDDLLSMRVAMMVVSVLAVWAAYLLGRELFQSRAAGAVSAATLLSLEGFVTYATDGPREKTVMVLFILLALLALVRRRWATVGAMTALATLTWQGAFLPLAAGALLTIALHPGGCPRVSALLRWAVGGLTVVGVMLAYFAAVHALPELWEGFYAVNAGWTEQQGLIETLTTDRQRLVTGYGWSLVLLVGGLLGSIVVAALRLRHFDREDPSDVSTLAVALGTVMCVSWALQSFEGWPDAFVALPYIACGIAGVVHLALRRLPPVAATTFSTVLVTAALVVAVAGAAADRGTGLGEQQRHHDAVLGVLGEDVDLLVVDNPVPLVLGRHRNPIRYQLFGGGMGEYLEDTYPGGLAGLADRIARLQPTVLTVRTPVHEWLQGVLSRDYLRVGGQRRGYTWFASISRTTVEQRQAMKAAARKTLPSAGRVAVQASLP